MSEKVINVGHVMNLSNIVDTIPKTQAKAIKYSIEVPGYDKLKGVGVY